MFKKNITFFCGAVKEKASTDILQLRRLLVELELETLDESLPGEGVSVLGVSLCLSPSTTTSLSARTPAPSSQPFRLLKVILAFRMW